VGNAGFWWQPAGQPLQALDLGRPVSDLQAQEVRRESVSDSVSGQRTKVIYYAGTQLRITAELLTDLSVVRPLQTMINHLQSGGMVAFAEDVDRVIGGFLRTAPTYGGTTLRLEEDLFQDWVTGGGGYKLTATDAVVLHTPSPEYRVDELLVSSQTNRTISLAEGTRYNFTDSRWIFARHRGFWPFLRLPSGGTNAIHLSTDRRISWGLDLQLEEAPTAYENLASDPTQPLAGEATEVQQGQTGYVDVSLPRIEGLADSGDLSGSVIAGGWYTFS